MLRLILRYRLVIWWRALRSRRGASRGAGAFGAVVLLVVALVAFQFGYFSAAGATDPNAIVVAIFAALAVLITMFGVSVGLTELFVSSDIELLLTAPLRPVTLFALKTFDTSRAAAGIGAAGVCALAGWGAAMHVNAALYLLAVPVVGVFAVGATLLDLCLILVLTRLVPAHRLRNAVLLIGSVGGALLWLLVEAPRRASVPSRFTDFAAPFDRTPAGWAAHGLTAAAQGHGVGALTNLGGLLLLTLLLGIVGALLFGKVYLAGLDAMRAAASRPRSDRRARPRRSGAAPGVLLALAIKDWRLTVRDVPYLSSLLPALIYAAAWPVILLLRAHNLDARTARVLEFGSLPLVALIAAYRPALAAIAREGSAFDVLRASPAHAREVIGGKAIAVGLPVSVVVIVAGVVVDAVQRAPVWMYGVSALGAIALGFGCSLIGAAIGAYNPRFDQPQSARAGQLPTAGCLIYAGVAGLFGLGAFTLVAALLSIAIGASVNPALAVVAVVVFAIGIVALVLAVGVGLRRLSALLAPER